MSDCVPAQWRAETENAADPRIRQAGNLEVHPLGDQESGASEREKQMQIQILVPVRTDDVQHATDSDRVRVQERRIVLRYLESRYEYEFRVGLEETRCRHRTLTAFRFPTFYLGHTPEPGDFHTYDCIFHPAVTRQAQMSVAYSATGTFRVGICPLKACRSSGHAALSGVGMNLYYSSVMS
jgi:hypothetical protein